MPIFLVVGFLFSFGLAERPINTVFLSLFNIIQIIGKSGQAEKETRKAGTTQKKTGNADKQGAGGAKKAIP